MLLQMRSSSTRREASRLCFVREMFCRRMACINMKTNQIRRRVIIEFTTNITPKKADQLQDQIGESLVPLVDELFERLCDSDTTWEIRGNSPIDAKTILES